MNTQKLNMENHAIIFTIIVYIIFIILTIYPPDNKIFIDPITNKKGIVIDKK